MGHAASAETRDRRVGIVNETGVTIVRFHGATTGSDDRQEDFPCRDVLPSGTFAFTGFGGDTGRCRQDLPAIFDDGDGGMQSEVDSCEGGPLTFN